MLLTYSFIACGQNVGTFITVLLLAFTQKESISNTNFFAMMFILRELSEKLCLSFPNVIRNITDMRSALVRMESFLQHDDSLNFGQFKNKSNLEAGKSSSAQTLRKNESPDIHEVLNKVHENKQLPHLDLKQVSCKLPARDFHLSRKSNFTEILTDITIKRDSPGLVLICGPVGSGKTLLLATVLGGELEITKGLVKYATTLAYVSDNPWVFPGTIRENILFYLPYNEKFYHEVIKVCQLEKDLNSLPNKDLACIGEHGATLSGGQRTRISLARAVYSQADIYLLDDPLSSLDAKVAEKIFR